MDGSLNNAAGDNRCCNNVFVCFVSCLQNRIDGQRARYDNYRQVYRAAGSYHDRAALRADRVKVKVI